jgi:hypothetical protein
VRVWRTEPSVRVLPRVAQRCLDNLDIGARTVPLLTALPYRRILILIEQSR